MVSPKVFSKSEFSELDFPDTYIEDGLNDLKFTKKSPNADDVMKYMIGYMEEEEGSYKELLENFVGTFGFEELVDKYGADPKLLTEVLKDAWELFDFKTVDVKVTMTSSPR